MIENEPALCGKCRHYLYVHPCKGWRRGAVYVRLNGQLYLMMRRCRCKGRKDPRS